MHAYIHTYYIHTYVCIHTYIRMYTYIHTYVYIHTCIHIRIHTYIHTCMHIHTHIHTYMHTYTYIHTYIHACIHIHTYIHTYVHTYIPALKYTTPTSRPGTEEVSSPRQTARPAPPLASRAPRAPHVFPRAQTLSDIDRTRCPRWAVQGRGNRHDAHPVTWTCPLFFFLYRRSAVAIPCAVPDMGLLSGQSEG